jgi:signal transduction histidine kinase
VYYGGAKIWSACCRAQKNSTASPTKPSRSHFHYSSDLPEVEHDSDQVHQVLLNLLLNAVQAIEKVGTVSVVIGTRDGFATVVVSDSGRGISAQNLPNIFRPFYTTKGDGTGLGLSLAQRIVEDHHGRIEVSSVVGKGSTFTVLLPFQMPVVQVAAS